MRYFIRLSKFVIPLTLIAILAAPAFAQESPPTVPARDLTLFTKYPVQQAAIGQTASIPISIQTGAVAQIVDLSISGLPEGWTATFKGGSRVIESVYVQPDNTVSVDLKIDVPATAVADTYSFAVVGDGEKGNDRFTIKLMLEEQLPPSLAFNIDLPTIRGGPDATFRYDVSLVNEGDQDLTVALTADTPAGFQVNFKSSGKEVVSLPIAANETKRLSVEAQAFADISAGDYQFVVRADGGEAQAQVNLTAEVTGQSQLSISTPDGRLSGEAHAGEATTLSLIVRNTGSAPARNVQLTATQPNGWTVDFDSSQIAEIPANGQVEVTTSITPADEAVAGDYVVTLRARPDESSGKSAEFRITVRTSTAWGIAGVALIAAAVVIVGLAVTRFGRR